MKDTVKAVVFILTAVTLSVSGCSPKDDTSYFYDVVDATSAIETYEGFTETEIEGYYGDDEISVNAVRDISLRDEPFFADVNESVSFDSKDESLTQDTRMILDSEDGTDMGYLYRDGQWVKEKLDVEDLRTEISKCDALESGLMLMKASTNIQELGSSEINGEEVTVYEGIIPEIMIPDVLDITGAAFRFKTDWDQSYYENIGDLHVTMFVNSDDIVIGYELDITDIMQNIVDVFYEENDIGDSYEDIRFESFKAKGIVNTYDMEIDDTIPQEALTADEITANDDIMENQ